MYRRIYILVRTVGYFDVYAMNEGGMKHMMDSSHTHITVLVTYRNAYDMCYN
jgi:hypothetical protein